VGVPANPRVFSAVELLSLRAKRFATPKSRLFTCSVAVGTIFPGFEVAIDDATGMGCHQGICALHGDVEKLLNSERIPQARAG
jgi:hypothetical protein